MAKQWEDIVLAEAYINGELPQPEHLFIEKRLINDPEFAQLVEDLRILLRAASKSYFVTNVKEQLTQIEKTLPPIDTKGEFSLKDPLAAGENFTFKTWRARFLPPHPKKKGETKFVVPRWLRRAVAAALLLGTGLLFWLSFPAQPPEEKLFRQYFNPPKMEERRVRTVKPKEQLRSEAINHFNRKKYEEAVPLLAELFEAHQDTVSLFFMGLSLLGSEQPIKATETLINYNKIYEDIRYPDVNYYIGLAYLKANDLEKAISFLEIDGSEKARMLIAQIKKL